MNPTFKKIIAFILIVSFVVPATLFARPKKADAFLDCFLGNILGGVNSAISSGIGSALAVPVHDASHTQISGQNYGENKAQTTKECVLDKIVTVLANTMIRQFTNSVVDWINRGFHGSPSFVTNPEGFFMEIGDIAIGQSIEELGAIGELLCSGFDLDLRLALGLQYSAGRKEYVGCRLSDVQKNVMNSFTKGTFGGSSGWSTWFTIHSEPTNNPYGTYFRLRAETDKKILKFQNRKLQELSEGKGFLSYKKCPSSDSEQARKEDLAGKCTTVTPGSVIETQLNDHLGSATRRIEVADEINEIIGALVNQALLQVMGATGLAGNSSPSYGGGQSYVYRTLSDTQKAYEEELRIQQQTTLPDGLVSHKDQSSPLTCEEFSKNSYQTRAQASGNTTSYRVWFQEPFYTNGVITSFSDYKQAIKKDGTPWDDIDLRKMNAFCSNERQRATAEQFTPGVSFNFGSQDTSENPPVNLSTRRQTRQSSPSSSYPEHTSDKAVDGSSYYGAIVGASGSVAMGCDLPCWEVELERRSFVDHVNVYFWDNYKNPDLIGNLRVELFDISETGQRIPTKEIKGTDAVRRRVSSDPIPWKIPVGEYGRFVRITRTTANEIWLGEVEVMGRNTGVSQTGSTGGSNVEPLQVVVTPPTQEIAIRKGDENLLSGTPATRAGTSVVTTNKILDGVTATISLRGNNVDQEFGRAFETAEVAIVNTSQGNNAVILNQTLPTGAPSVSSTASVSLQPNQTYEIRPILRVKSSLITDEKRELTITLKNAAGSPIGKSVVTIIIGN